MKKPNYKNVRLDVVFALYSGILVGGTSGMIAGANEIAVKYGDACPPKETVEQTFANNLGKVGLPAGVLGSTAMAGTMIYFAKRRRPVNKLIA